MLNDISSPIYERIKKAVFDNYCGNPARIENSTELKALSLNLVIPPEEELYMAFSADISSKAAFGTVLAGKGIYIKSESGGPSFTPWENISGGIVYNDNTIDSLYLMNPETMTQMKLAVLRGIDKNVIDFFQRLVNDLQWIFKRREQIPCICSLPADFTEPDYEAVLSQCLSSLRSDLLADLSTGSHQRLIDELLIPVDETIYFCHDDTALHNGKRGCAFSSRGINVKYSAELPDFIPWSQIAANRLYAFKGHIYTEDSVYKRLLCIGVFSSNITKAMGLYCALAIAFRKAAQGEAKREIKEKNLPERFSEHYDMSGLNKLFSPHNLAALRYTAEPYAGKISFCYKDSKMSFIGYKAVWIALGDKGIVFTGPGFIPWEDFKNARISLRKASQVKPDADKLLLSDQYSAFGLYINDILLPCADFAHSMQFCIFFLELQRYMLDPDNYSEAHISWTPQRQELLILYHHSKEVQGIFKKAQKDKAEAIRRFLELPYGSEPLYYIPEHSLSGREGYKAVIDRQGFSVFSRLSGLDFHCCSFSQFISSPFYAVSFEDQCLFFSGSRLLLRLFAGRKNQRLTYDFLSELRKVLLDGTWHSLG